MNTRVSRSSSPRGAGAYNNIPVVRSPANHVLLTYSQTTSPMTVKRPSQESLVNGTPPPNMMRASMLASTPNSMSYSRLGDGELSSNSKRGLTPELIQYMDTLEKRCREKDEKIANLQREIKIVKEISNLREAEATQLDEKCQKLQAEIDRLKTQTTSRTDAVEMRQLREENERLNSRCKALKRDVDMRQRIMTSCFNNLKPYCADGAIPDQNPDLESESEDDISALQHSFQEERIKLKNPAKATQRSPIKIIPRYIPPNNQQGKGTSQHTISFGLPTSSSTPVAKNASSTPAPKNSSSNNAPKNSSSAATPKNSSATATATPKNLSSTPAPKKSKATPTPYRTILPKGKLPLSNIRPFSISPITPNVSLSNGIRDPKKVSFSQETPKSPDIIDLTSAPKSGRSEQAQSTSATASGNCHSCLVMALLRSR